MKKPNMHSSSVHHLFSISIKSKADPLLPLVAFAICWTAFAILNARFRQSKTLEKTLSYHIRMRKEESVQCQWSYIFLPHGFGGCYNYPNLLNGIPFSISDTIMVIKPKQMWASINSSTLVRFLQQLCRILRIIKDELKLVYV